MTLTSLVMAIHSRELLHRGGRFSIRSWRAMDNRFEPIQTGTGSGGDYAIGVYERDDRSVELTSDAHSGS